LSEAEDVSKRGLGRGLESLMDRPAAEEPRTVRVSVTNVDAPGLRQFLNRKTESEEAPSGKGVVQAKAGAAPSPFSPITIGATLLIADAVVVALSFLLLISSAQTLVRAVACAGFVAAAALGVIGARLLFTSKQVD
jgi:hypothetical protein